MRLKRGKDLYKTPAIGMLHSVFVDGGMSYALAQVRFNEIMKMGAESPDVLGFPTCFHIDQSAKTIIVFPKPDRAYELKIRYFPPMVEA